MLPSPREMTLRRLATLTAAPRSPTPPSLFCLFLLLRVRLLLRWWPRESEGERAVHRPHTHFSFPLSLCVSPCMDSRPHLIPRSTHIMCPLYICMHTHAGPLVLSFARHAPLPFCLAAWAEHRNCFCFCFSIALSGRPLSLSLPVGLCGSNESVCAGRPTLRLFLFCFFHCFTCVVVESTHSAGCVCVYDMRNLRVCYPLLFLLLLYLLSLDPHSCSASVGADKHKCTCTHTQTVLHTLWSGVYAENARTHAQDFGCGGTWEEE
ncbi:hypothetical protein ECC02_010589 [Trypanosoma cruzi]|uniref:Uncharacterized protein n=1 Tax=Trypanosoma cruzi TaxID=5693 RepID=A0A7J6XQX3_TRYCR|nr:hypothetical protein ECC02_010589 [Trypanosoma cruzi]